jgi:hypothetical protein
MGLSGAASPVPKGGSDGWSQFFQEPFADKWKETAVLEADYDLKLVQEHYTPGESALDFGQRMRVRVLDNFLVNSKGLSYQECTTRALV